MTEMSRIERKKKEREKAQAELARQTAPEPEIREDEIPSRQSYHEKKKNSKKKNKNRNPLFTSLAVIFLFIPIIVFLVFMYMMNQGGTNPEQYDDVFYEKSGDTGFLNEKNGGDQEADQKADSEQKAAALQEKKQENSEKTDETPKKETAQEQPTEDKKTEDKPAAAENKPAVTAKKSEDKSASTKKNTAKAPPVRQAPQPKKVIQHTVAEKEPLYRISMKYYKDRSGEEKIRNYNQLSGNNVYAGQVLDIPFY